MSDRLTRTKGGASIGASVDFADLIGADRAATMSVDRRQEAHPKTGRLVGFVPDGHVPLVTYPGQPVLEAVRSRATLDLDSTHIGSEVVLVFDEGDPLRPIILGCLTRQDTSSLEAPRNVEIDADGRRLVISAADRIILRCGRASLTLTKDGKILLDGAYVSNHSSGVLRLKGGSVQIN